MRLLYLLRMRVLSCYQSAIQRSTCFFPWETSLYRPGFPEIDKIVFNIMFLFSISVKLRGGKGNKKKVEFFRHEAVNFVGEVS